ncbi:hypothetical protein N9B44_00135 [bacterium]|nr:hypothetical protein [bacterium]
MAKKKAPAKKKVAKTSAVKKTARKKVFKKQSLEKTTAKSGRKDLPATLSEDYKNQQARLKDLVSGQLQKNLPELSVRLQEIDPCTADLKDLFTLRVVSSIARTLDIANWNVASEVLKEHQSIHEDLMSEIVKAVQKISTNPKLRNFLQQMLSASIHSALMPTMIKAIKTKKQWGSGFNDRIDIKGQKHKGGSSLTVDGARLIAAYNPKTLLCRNGSVSFSDEIVTALSESNRAKDCELDAVDLTELAAESFAILPGNGELRITISSLNPAAASFLADRSGNLVILGLDSLSNETASQLKHFRGILSLPDVSKISASVSEELAAFQGKSLLLDGVKSITDEAALHLAKCKNITLRGLRSLPEGQGGELLILKSIRSGSGRIQVYLSLTKLTKQQASIVVKSAKKRRISLNWLSKLDPDTATELAKCKGTLEIACKSKPALKSITAEVSEALSNHKGLLKLGITKLTQNVAEGLGRHVGPISFSNLQTLDAATTENLCLNKSGITLPYEIKIDKESISILSSYEGDLCLPPRIQSRVAAARRKNKRD